MSNTTPKLEVVPPDDGPMSIAKPDEFNLDKFKSTRAATMANVETLLNGLPHHKISDAKDFAAAPQRTGLLLGRVVLRQCANQGRQEGCDASHR